MMGYSRRRWVEHIAHMDGSKYKVLIGKEITKKTQAWMEM
jgi:hypothetical protein